MKKAFFFLLLFTTVTASFAEEPPKYLSDIYNNIFRSMANGVFIKPKLVLVNDLQFEQGNKEVATYSPSDRTITVGISFLLLTRKFGVDSNNSRAHVLSHELAHLFLNHGYANVIGTGFASSTFNKELIKSKTEIETKMGESEADQWAFFYAHIAGYKTNKIVPQLLDSIYRFYQLTDEKLSKYPPLAERKNYATQASDKMKSMCDAFDFATIGLVHGDFGLSIEIYSAIIEEGFKSREIISNLGTAYLLQAIQQIDTMQLPFILPVQLDVTTRLNQNILRSIVDKQVIIDLLTRSAELYNQAITIDPDYTTGYLNLSIADWLLNKKEDSEYFLNKANNNTDNYFIQKVALFKAIVLVSSSDPKQKAEGRKLLSDLAKKGNLLASLNSNILEQKSITNNKGNYPLIIKELSIQKLPTDMQNSTNILANTFSKDQSKTLSCKEIISPIQYRKWKSIKETSYIAFQYLFEKEISYNTKELNKKILYENADVIFETTTVIFFKFGDVILVLSPEGRLNYQIIKTV